LYAEPEIIRNTLAPNDFPSILAKEWLQNYINLYGCHSPMDDKIQISLSKRKTLFKIYESELKTRCDSVTEKKFLEIWRVSFPNVILRKFCGIFGKCWECYYISSAMQKATTEAERRAFTKLSYMHRGGSYMVARAL
jgi:hypothetical protein